MKDSEVHHLMKRFVMVVTLNQNHDNELCPVCPWSTLQALVFVWCFFFLHDRELRQIHHETK